MKKDNTTYSVSRFKEMHENKRLIIPEYQRRLTWIEKAKIYLNDSIIKDMPIPPIYLSKYIKNSVEYHEVIDGQQRLNAIFEYMQDMFIITGDKLPNRVTADSKFDGKLWSELNKKEQDSFLKYNFIVSVIDGTEEEIIDMFIRLNKYTSKMNPQEIRNAYLTGNFHDLVNEMTDIYGLKRPLKVIPKEDKKGRKESKIFFWKHSIVSEQQFRRMKDAEFTAWLLNIIFNGESGEDLPNKRKEIDDLYFLYRLKSITKYRVVFKRIMKNVERIIDAFGDNDPFRATPFKNQSNFGVLFKVVYDFYKEGKIISDESVKAIVKFIRAFAKEYNKESDKIEDAQILLFKEKTRANGNERSNMLFKINYLKRHLDPLVLSLDTNRIFTEEQRLFIWHSSEDKKCVICDNVVSFDDYHCDHIVPWTKKGRTTVDNGQLVCSSCNLKKGNKIP